MPGTLSLVRSLLVVWPQLTALVAGASSCSRPPMWRSSARRSAPDRRPGTTNLGWFWLVRSLGARNSAGTCRGSLAVAGTAAITLHRCSAATGTAPATGPTAGPRYFWRHRVLRALTLFTAVMKLV